MNKSLSAATCSVPPAQTAIVDDILGSLIDLMWMEMDSRNRVQIQALIIRALPHLSTETLTMMLAKSVRQHVAFSWLQPHVTAVLEDRWLKLIPFATFQ